jgi:hypothetical protein
LRRVLALAVIGLLLLAAFGGLGWYFLESAGPEALRQRLEVGLSEALGTQVGLGAVALAMDRDGLELTTSALRAFPTEAGGHALVADRVEIQLDPWAALAGNLRVRGLELLGPSLRLRRAGRSFEIDAPTRLTKAAPTSAPWYQALAAAVPRVTIAEGRIAVVDGAGPGRELSVEGLSGSLLRRWLRGGIALHAEGALAAGGEAAGRIGIEGDAGERSSWNVELDDLSLAALAPLAGLGDRALGLRGRVTGALELEGAGARPTRIRVRLAAKRLRLRPELAGARRPLSLANLRVDAHAEGRSARWSGAGQLGVGALLLPFEGRLGEDGVEQLALRGVDLAALPPLAAALAEPDRSRAQAVLDRLEGGRLEQLELTREAGKGDGAPPHLRASWQIADASVEVGSASRLAGLSLAGSYDGDVLELRDIRTQLDGDPLPLLELRLAGLANIRGTSELRCVEPAPASALPGRIPLVKWIEGERAPGAPPSWRRLRLDVAWLEHPALLCTVERLRGELVPDPESRGVKATLERAVWAGAPVSGSAAYSALPEEHASLRLEIGPPFEPSQPELRQSGWARGRFEFETTSLGRWKTRDATGGFLAGGSRLLLDEVTLRLDPGPELHGSIDLDLGQTERAPFEVRAEVREGRLEDVYAAGGWADQATGSLVGTARVRGAVRPGHAVLGDAQGSVSLHARSGVIRQPFRLFLAVGMASETLNPFRERGTIRYDAMDAELHLADGSYVFDILQVDGPALRAAAHGRIGTTGPHDAEMVMGLFFFRTLDDVIGRLPILNRIFLGKDENLIGAYVALTGPWEQMQARVIPTKTLLRGPVSFVFEGLPSFVRDSLERVQAMLPSAEPPPASKEDS